MSLSTYAELQASIAGWLFDRTDLTEEIKDFIRLAEAQMQRELRSFRMVERVDLTISTQYTAAPENHLETIRLFIDDLRLDAVTPQDMAEKREYDDTAGQPRFFAMSGTDFEVYPTPDETYTGKLQYYRTIPALAADNTTNWLLTNHPDAYLYGSLMQAGVFLADQTLIQRVQTLYAGAVKDIGNESEAQMFTGPIKMQFKRGR